MSFLWAAASEELFDCSNSDQAHTNVEFHMPVSFLYPAAPGQITKLVHLCPSIGAISSSNLISCKSPGYKILLI